jgi:hypothetical protein
MQNEEVLRIYNEMVEIFGDHLPNPEQEPIRFAYYVKLYKYYHIQSQSASAGVSSASGGS